MAQRDMVAATKTSGGMSRVTQEQMGETRQGLQPEPLAHATALTGYTGAHTHQAEMRNCTTGGQLSRGSHALLQLQRHYGNRHVQRRLAQAQRPFIQPKLMLGPAGDTYEQEADRVARQVVSQPSSPTTIQRIQPAAEDALAQRLPLRESAGIAPDVETAVQQARRGGAALPESVRQPMEQAFGADFSAVRIYTGAQSNTLNRALSARAFTTGQDIFFRQGEYRPGSRAGQEVLAHELTHVIQQRGGGIQRLEAKQSGVSTHEVGGTAPRIHPFRPGTGTDELVQRKFGFEVELQVALTKKVQETRDVKSGNIWKPTITPTLVDLYKDPLDVWGVNPAMTTNYPTVADAGDFEIKVDHNKSVVVRLDNEKPVSPTNDTENTRGAIAELVTKPMDENLPVNQVEAKMQSLVDFANAVNYSNNGRQQLNTVGVNNAPNSIYIGMNYKVNFQKKIGQIQATHGIKLEHIDTLLTELASAGKKIDPQNQKPQIWAQGAKIAQEYMGGWDFSPTGASKAEQNELLGLLSLISNYLVAQAIHTGIGWGKNKLGGLFYKSRLSDVANQLSNGTLRNWLATNANMIADDLTQQAGVKGQMITSFLTCEAWVKEVLQGTGDAVYEDNKNPYIANPLGPEPVGPTADLGLGAVIENRSLALLLTTDILGTGAGTPVDKWVEVAKAFHACTQIINT